MQPMPTPSNEEIQIRNERQTEILRWCKEAFAQPNGDLDETEPDTRLLRFIEEAVELAQAHGLPIELIHKQVDITYARPPGDVPQEIGGVMVTLQAYCASTERSLASCEWVEIGRCNAKPIEHFQRRQKEKREQGL